MASSSRNFPFPADKLVLKENKEAEEWTKLRKNRSRRERRVEKEQKALLSYTGESLSDQPSGQKKLKLTPFQPQETTGTLGPETSNVVLTPRDDILATSGSESFEMVDHSSDTAMSDIEAPSGLEASISLSEPKAPPKFSNEVKIIEGMKVYKLTSPHSGLEVDDRTKKLLLRMEQREVEELLRPLTYTESNLEGTHRVVEHYWLARVQQQQEIVWSKLGRRSNSEASKSGVAWTHEPTHWVGHSQTAWVCSNCSIPRSWNPQKQLACLACKSRDPPKEATRPNLQLAVDSPEGKETWSLTFVDGAPKWHVETPQPTGTFGPETGKGSSIHTTNEMAVKLSLGEDAGSFAQDCPAIHITEDAQCFSDYVPKQARSMAHLIDFGDAALRSSCAALGEEPPSYDDTQISVVFHPDLVKAKSQMVSLSGAVNDLERTSSDATSRAVLLQEAEEQHEVLMELRAGALENEQVSLQASRLAQLDSEKLWKILHQDEQDRPTEWIVQAQTTMEEARKQNLERQTQGHANAIKFTPHAEPPSVWPEELRMAIEDGTLNPLTNVFNLDGDFLQAVLRKYLDFKSEVGLSKFVSTGRLFHRLPDFANLDPTGTLGPERVTEAELAALSNEEKAIGMIQWMIRRELGVIKLALGDWKLTPGDFVEPWWVSMLAKFSEQDLLALEMKTRPCSGDMFVEKPPYTVEQLEEHVKQNWRPKRHEIQAGCWAPSHLPGFHWTRAVSTWDLPTLIHSSMHRWTLRDLWNFWSSMPSVTKPKTGSTKKTLTKLKQSRLEMYLQAKRQTDEVLKELALPMPPKLDEYKMVLRKVGALLAARTFLSYTPQVVMELPIQPGHDSKATLRDRVTYDERVTLSKSMFAGLPEVWEKLQATVSGNTVEVTQFYRCNTQLWWLAEVKDGAMVNLIMRKLGTGTVGPESQVESGEAVNYMTTGEVPKEPSKDEAAQLVDQGILPPPTMAFAKSIVGKDYKKKNRLTGEWFWFSCECGLVLSACSSWEYITKEHGVTRSGYHCKHCRGKWVGNRGGSRMVQIGNGQNKIQLILVEPQEALYNQWANDRIEFYKRVEPNAPVRDVAPEFSEKAAHRLRLRKMASDAVWDVVLSNPEKAGLAAIQQLGRRHELKKVVFVPASSSSSS